MRLHDALNVRDRLSLCTMWFFTIIASGFVVYEKKQDISSFIIVVFISVLYFISCSHAMCHDFIVEEKKQKIHSVVRRALYGYCIGIVICFALFFLPKPIHAMLAVSAMLCLLLPLQYGTFLSIGIAIALCVSFDLPSYEVIYCMFSCLLGALAARYSNNRKYMMHTSIIIISLSVSMYFIGCYAAKQPIDEFTVLYGCAEGILNVLVAVVFFPFTSVEEDNDSTLEYAKTLEDDFPLVGFIFSLSKNRYDLCRIVSNICYMCAKTLEIDYELACCAGFYYSFCDNDENEPIKYAVSLLNQNHVPIEVVRILASYQGLNQPITSVEGAIVDLVDTAINRYYLECVKEDFHLEIFMHSLFNELSSSGRYDRCGLSMNQFLTVRDILIREADKL